MKGNLGDANRERAPAHLFRVDAVTFCDGGDGGDDDPDTKWYCAANLMPQPCGANTQADAQGPRQAGVLLEMHGAWRQVGRKKKEAEEAFTLRAQDWDAPICERSKVLAAGWVNFKLYCWSVVF